MRKYSAHECFAALRVVVGVPRGSGHTSGHTALDATRSGEDSEEKERKAAVFQAVARAEFLRKPAIVGDDSGHTRGEEWRIARQSPVSKDRRARTFVAVVIVESHRVVERGASCSGATRRTTAEKTTKARAQLIERRSRPCISGSRSVTAPRRSPARNAMGPQSPRTTPLAVAAEDGEEAPPPESFPMRGAHRLVAGILSLAVIAAEDVQGETRAPQRDQGRAQPRSRCQRRRQQAIQPRQQHEAEPPADIRDTRILEPHADRPHEGRRSEDHAQPMSASVIPVTIAGSPTARHGGAAARSCAGGASPPLLAQQAIKWSRARRR